VEESTSSIDVEKYLRICEQLGQEPDPKRMPLETSEFPDEVQVAFFIYGMISDKWDGMSGSYLGKDWNEVHKMFDLYSIDDRVEVLYFMQVYDALIMKQRFENQKRKEKQREQQRGGGKTYTHNVRG